MPYELNNPGKMEPERYARAEHHRLKHQHLRYEPVYHE